MAFMQLDFSRAPGNIVDWMYKKMGVKYSFAAHLRDTGTVSLVFNPKFMLSCCFSMALLSQSNGYDRSAKKQRR
jgi:hypothetical protein